MPRRGRTAEPGAVAAGVRKLHGPGAERYWHPIPVRTLLKLAEMARTATVQEGNRTIQVGQSVPAAFVAILAACRWDRPELEAALPIEDVAALAGMSRRTFSRAAAALKAAGLLRDVPIPRGCPGLWVVSKLWITAGEPAPESEGLGHPWPNPMPPVAPPNMSQTPVKPLSESSLRGYGSCSFHAEKKVMHGQKPGGPKPGTWAAPEDERTRFLEDLGLEPDVARVLAARTTMARLASAREVGKERGLFGRELRMWVCAAVRRDQKVTG